MQLEVLRQFLGQNVDFKEIIRIVMFGDECDPVPIWCPCEASSKSSEIGSDLLIFLTEKLLRDTLDAFTCFCGHEDNFQKSVISGDVSDKIAARGPDRFNVMRISRFLCKVLRYQIRQFPVLNEGPVAFSDCLPPRLIKFFEFYPENLSENMVDVLCATLS